MTAALLFLGKEDEFESLDDAPMDEFDQLDLSVKETDQSAHEETQDSHEPPNEPGLAGLDDGEEEAYDEEMADEEERKKPISPVTWDVDVHEGGNISVSTACRITTIPIGCFM